MSLKLDKGYTDSQEDKAVLIPDLSYKSDFATSSDTASEVILSNTTSPIDRVETIRFAIQNVKDVYNGTDIDPGVQAASHRGVSLVCQVSDTYSYYDDADPANKRVDLPVSAHLVIKAPKSSFIGADDYLAIAKRAFASLFETGSTTSDRLVSLLRGALDPRN